MQKQSLEQSKKILDTNAYPDQRTELQIENEILNWVRWHGFGCWKTKNKGELHTAKGREFFKAGANSGFQDLTCCVRGLFVAIEVKRPKRKQTLNQIKHQEEVQRARVDGVYFVATCIEDVEKQFKKRGWI